MEVRDVFIPSSVQMPAPKVAEVQSAQFSQVMSRQAANHQQTVEKPATVQTNAKVQSGEAKVQSNQADAAKNQTAGAEQKQETAASETNTEKTEEAAADVMTVDVPEEAAPEDVDDLEKSFAELEVFVASLIAKPTEQGCEAAADVLQEVPTQVESLPKTNQTSQSLKTLDAYGMVVEPVEKDALYGKLMEVFAPPAKVQSEQVMPTVQETAVEATAESAGELLEFEVLSEVAVKTEASKHEKSEAISAAAAEKPETEQAPEKLTKVAQGAESGEVKDDKGKKFAREFTVSLNTQKTEVAKHYEVMESKADAPIVRQVVEAITADVRILPSGRAVEVQLTPEHLGKVVMKLELHEGAMTANIKVENPEVKAALEASIQELKNALSEKGITVKEVNVEVNKDGHRGGQQYSGEGGRRREQDEETKRFELKTEKEEQ